MPYVDVIRKREVEGLPQWDFLSGLVKVAVASGVNATMNPKTELKPAEVHAYGSDKDGCPDAPGLLVNIDFTTGTPEQNKELREWVQDVLEKSRHLTGIKVGVYTRPVFGASFGMKEL